MKICNVQVKTPFGPVNRLGVLEKEGVVDLNKVWEHFYRTQGRYNPSTRANHVMPSSLHLFLQTSDFPLDDLQQTMELFQLYYKAGDALDSILITDEYKFDCPLDKITTYRDFYAHEKHVAAGFKKRKEPIPPAWYEIPAYYKGATEGFIGDQDEILWPHYTDVLDYELELGAIIAIEGRNIKAENACEHILGFTILNDISARDIQKKEMAVRLGPAKGKDFCSVMGPVITTIDEFDNKEPNLLMTAKVNGNEWSRGQSGDSHFTFSQMIEHVSMDEWVLPGDFMGSGTVGTGCGLELDKWIKEGDILELSIESIGTLTNKVGRKSS